MLLSLLVNAQFNSITWQFSGLANSRVSDIHCHGSNVVFASSNHGLYKSVNSGLTWTNITSLDMGNIVRDIFMTKDSLLYIGSKSGLYFSNDKGTVWSKIYNSTSMSDVRNIFVDKTNRIFISVIDSSISFSSWSVLVSSDNGTSWLSADSGVIGYNRIKYFSTDTAGNVYGLAGEGLIGYDIFYKLDDDSLIWKNVCNFPGSLIVNQIVNTTNDSFIGTTADGMMISNDHGLTWAPIGLYPYPCVSIAIDSQDQLIVGTTYTGVYFSNNMGASWINNQLTIPRNPYVAGSFPDPIYSIATSVDGGIYIGTRDSGIYRSDMPLAVLEIIPNNNVSFYPNPSENYLFFKSINQIDKIIIYDANLGELFYSEIHAGQSQIDISYLTAGVYIIFVEMNDKKSGYYTIVKE